MFSPALPQGYLRAASQISRLAVGDRAASPDHRDLPRARRPKTRCATSRARRSDRAAARRSSHTFPADGLYRFHATLVRTVSGELFGNTAVYMAGRNELLEISVNGERVAVLEVDQGMNDAGEKGLTLETPPIADQGGTAADCRRVRAAVGRAGRRSARADRSDADRHAHRHRLRRDDGAAPAGAGDRRADERDRRVGHAEPPQDLHLSSDHAGAGARVRHRHPATARHAGVSRAGARRPQRSARLLRAGAHRRRRLRRRASASASRGSSRTRASCSAWSRRRTLVERRLSPHRRRSRVAAVVLPVGHAARSGTAEGRQATARSGIRPSSTSRSQRMLADPRSRALATRFAAQWLRLQDVDKVRPDGLLFPNWDGSLSDAFVRETELFFDSIVRENRSVLDLITADYTFVNERLARHYGIPNVTGPEFRRVRAARAAPRPADAGQRAAAHVGRRSHVARAARQVGAAGAARLAAAAAAAQRAGVRGHEGFRGRPVPLGARADGAAPLEPRVHVVPPRHRSDRPRARELRRRRPLPDQGQRRAGRFDRAALRRHGDGGRGRPAQRAAEAPGRVPDDLCREPDDLRARPARRGVRHAGAPRDRARRRQAERSDRRVHRRHHAKRRRFR